MKTKRYDTGTGIENISTPVHHIKQKRINTEGKTMKHAGGYGKQLHNISKLEENSLVSCIYM